MDLELRPTPCDLFARLDERRDRPRFWVPDGTSWRPVTWGAFALDVEKVARALEAIGLAPGDRAAMLGPSSVSWFASALGIQAAHGVMVPIYPASTADQVAYVVAHSGAKVLFIDGEALFERVLERWSEHANVQRFIWAGEPSALEAIVHNVRARGRPVPSSAELDRRVMPLSALLARGRDLRAKDPAAFTQMLSSLSLDRPGTMIYTSGTTGNPKGVVLTHRNFASNARDWIVALEGRAKENQVDLFWLPPSHIFGWGELCNGNILGWTSWLATPKDVLEKMPIVKPSVFLSVPAYWEKLAQQALAIEDPVARKAHLVAATGGNLEMCLSGGAGLKARVKEVFLDAGILLLEGYGLTETSPTLTLNRPDDFRFDTVGKPLASVRVKLAADGEILAKGPNVFLGYHEDPKATAEAFDEGGWFKTGDIGRFTEDGFLRIVDRKKEILVTAGGKNVPPQNIELRFKDDPEIAQLVVYGDGKKFLVAGVWLHAAIGPETHARVEARIAEVNRDLASYETIKKFTIMERPLTIEDGFLTPTLKLKRKKVYEAFGAQLEALYA